MNPNSKEMMVDYCSIRDMQINKNIGKEEDGKGRIHWWNDEQFDTWLAYHLSVCCEKTIIDMSNHVVLHSFPCEGR